MYIIDSFATLGKELSNYSKEKYGKPVHLSFGYAFMGKALEWAEVMWDRGGLGPAGETWNGGSGGRGSVDLWKLAEWHHEHQCYMAASIEDTTLENGPISAIEEEVKEWVLKHKHMPKFAPAINPTYWTPPEHTDAAIATFKRYARY